MTDTTSMLKRSVAGQGQLVGTLGAMAAAFCCAGIPLATALLASLGVSFLRNDWLLFPVELICFVWVARGLIQCRSRHGRNGPMLCGRSGLGLLLVGMLAHGAPSTVCLVWVRVCCRGL